MDDKFTHEFVIFPFYLYSKLKVAPFQGGGVNPLRFRERLEHFFHRQQDRCLKLGKAAASRDRFIARTNGRLAAFVELQAAIYR